MKSIIVYYRYAPSQPEASETALREQRAAVADYVREHAAVVIAEFTEEASGSSGEIYSEAYCASLRAGADLVIASLQPIGAGGALRHPSVPLCDDDGNRIVHHIAPIILGEPLPTAARTLSMPADAPEGLFLHAVELMGSHSGIYLCNNTGVDIRDAKLFRVDQNVTPYEGLQSYRDPGGETWQALEAVQSNQCILLFEWDAIHESVHDFVLFWRDDTGEHCANAGFFGPSQFMPFRRVRIDPAGEGETPVNPPLSRYSTEAVRLDGYLTTSFSPDNWDLGALDENGGAVRLFARIGVISDHLFDGSPPSLAMAVEHRITRIVSLEPPTRVLEGTLMSRAELAALNALIEPYRALLLDYWHGRLTTEAFWREVEPSFS